MRNNYYTSTPNWFGGNTENIQQKDTTVKQYNTIITGVSNISISDTGDVISNATIDNTNKVINFTKVSVMDYIKVDNDSIILKNNVLSVSDTLLSKYINIDANQNINGIKNFINGVQFNSINVYENEGSIHIDSDLYVNGNLIDGSSQTNISVDSAFFTFKENKLTFSDQANVTKYLNLIPMNTGNVISNLVIDRENNGIQLHYKSMKYYNFADNVFSTSYDSVEKRTISIKDTANFSKNIQIKLEGEGNALVDVRFDPDFTFPDTDKGCWIFVRGNV